MSGGALIQLVVYGAQNIYLTGEPQITFFKSVYRRYTNFAKESIQQDTIGTIGVNSRIVATIARNGDLLSGLTIQYNPSKLIPPNSNIKCIASDLSHALIDHVEIEIGGLVIDSHYGKWLTIWRDLTQVNPYATQECISSTGEEPIQLHNYRRNYDQYPTGMNENNLPILPGNSTIYNKMAYTHGGVIYKDTVKIVSNGVVLNTTTPHDLVISDITDFLILGGTFTVTSSSITYTISYDTTDVSNSTLKNCLLISSISSTTYTTTTNKIINNTGTGTLSTTGAPSECYIPMQFWFCRNSGLALPLIALQYHEVKFNIYFNKKESFITLIDSSIPVVVDLSSIKIFGEYIYLDSAERRKFAQDAHEYLIEQVQFQNYNTPGDYKILLSFKHPVKELIFTGEPQQPYSVNNIQNNIQYQKPKPYYQNPAADPNSSNNYYYPVSWGKATPYPIIKKKINDTTFINGASTTNTTFTLLYNQIQRFSPRNLKYFTRNQLWETHTGSGSLVNKDCIGIYSFSLRPEEFQPSGTSNFSRVNNVRFISDGIDNTTETFNSLDIYAINYNVFRIMSGMGSVVYAS